MRLLRLTSTPAGVPNQNVFVDAITTWAQDSSKNVRVVYPHRDWGNPKESHFNVDDDDALIMMLKWPELQIVPWYGTIEPDDDEEVRVHCHDCGVYVYSVSGYEWKQYVHHRRYRCEKNQKGRCDFD